MADFNFFYDTEHELRKFDELLDPSSQKLGKIGFGFNPEDDSPHQDVIQNIVFIKYKEDEASEKLSYKCELRLNFKHLDTNGLEAFRRLTTTTSLHAFEFYANAIDQLSGFLFELNDCSRKLFSNETSKISDILKQSKLPDEQKSLVLRCFHELPRQSKHFDPKVFDDALASLTEQLNTPTHRQNEKIRHEAIRILVGLAKAEIVEHTTVKSVVQHNKKARNTIGMDFEITARVLTALKPIADAPLQKELLTLIEPICNPEKQILTLRSRVMIQDVQATFLRQLIANRHTPPEEKKVLTQALFQSMAMMTLFSAPCDLAAQLEPAMGLPKPVHTGLLEAASLSLMGVPTRIGSVENTDYQIYQKLLSRALQQDETDKGFAYALKVAEIAGSERTKLEQALHQLRAENCVLKAQLPVLATQIEVDKRKLVFLTSNELATLDLRSPTKRINQTVEPLIFTASKDGRLFVAQSEPALTNTAPATQHADAAGHAAAAPTETGAQPIDIKKKKRCIS